MSEKLNKWLTFQKNSAKIFMKFTTRADELKPNNKSIGGIIMGS